MLTALMAWYYGGVMAYVINAVLFAVLRIVHIVVVPWRMTPA